MKNGRERLTMTHLRVHTLMLAQEGKTETSITRDEFNDLKLDIELLNLFNWGDMKGVPDWFNVNGVTVTVKHD